MSKYKIIGQRFLRKYTAKKKTPVYSSQIDVHTIAESLCDVKWEKVSAKDATMSYHDEKLLDKNVVERDVFDAALFCSDHVDGLHLAPAYAAVYVYEMPATAVGKTLKSLKLQVTSDPYNSNGARIHVMAADELEIPTNCRICRGENDSGEIIADGSTVSSVAVRTTKTVGGNVYWYPTNETCNIAPTAMLLKKYLFIFVLMENYEAVRGNWIEGSSYIRNSVEIETLEDVVGWTDGSTYDLSNCAAREYTICRYGGLPFLKSEMTGLKTLTLQRMGDELVSMKLPTPGEKSDNAFSKVEYSFQSVLAQLDGPVTSVDVMQPVAVTLSNEIEYLRVVQFAVITGAFSKGSFTGLPGFLLYDLFRDRVLEDIPLTGFDRHLLAAARSGRLRGGFAYADGDIKTSAVVSVWALFEEGAFRDSSFKVSPFASFTIDQLSGEISNPSLQPNIWFEGDKKCHFIVQSGASESFKYDRIEHLYLEDGKIKPVEGKFTGHFPSSGVEYEGIINAIRPIRPVAYNEYKFVVSGNLKSVGGVSCKNCAIVTCTSTSASVQVPAFDSQITPDTYESFSVSHDLDSVLRRGPGNYSSGYGDEKRCIVSGAFNALGGNTTFRKAVDISDNNLTPRADLVDVSRVIGAVSINERCVIYGQGARKSTSIDVYDALSLRTSVTSVETAIGLRTLFAKFYTNKLNDISRSAVGSKVRIGAGFSVKPSSLSLNAFDGVTYLKVTVPTWQMTLSSLVVPFAVPQDFRASGIRLNWSNLTATPGAKLNVWLKRDSFIEEMPELSDKSYYLADKTLVDGWEHIGTIDGGESSSLLNIKVLTGYCATLLFTAFISMDDVNPPDGVLQAHGVAPQLDVDAITGAIEGLDKTWKPNITLIG